MSCVEIDDDEPVAIPVKLLAGSNIHLVVRECQRTLNEFGFNARFVFSFNGVPCSVDKHSDIDMLLSQYKCLLHARADGHQIQSANDLE
jgi:hypothetical protein